MQWFCLVNEFNFWGYDETCNWEVTEESIKSSKFDKINSEVAFIITYPIYFESQGGVEFKYRKDSLKSFFNNGEFKFVIDR